MSTTLTKRNHASWVKEISSLHFHPNFRKGKEQIAIPWMIVLGQKRKQQKLLHMGSFDLSLHSVERPTKSPYLYKSCSLSKSLYLQNEFQIDFIFKFSFEKICCLNWLATLGACNELHMSYQVMKCDKKQVGDKTVERRKNKEHRTV